MEITVTLTICPAYNLKIIYTFSHMLFQVCDDVNGICIHARQEQLVLTLK